MKRHRSTVVGLALVAMLAFSAVAAGSALANSAPRWKVANNYLLSPATKSIEAVSKTETLLRVPGISGLNLKAATGNCKLTGKIVGSAAGNPGTGEEGSFKCTGVEVEGASAVCTVGTAGTVTSNPLKGTLVWLASTGEKAGFKFAPESGTQFVSLVITGSECAVSGTYAVTGEVIAELLPVATNVIEGEVNLPKLPKAECKAANAITKWWTNATPRVEQTIGGLVVGSNPATICGNANGWIVGKTETIGVFAG